MTAPTSFAEPQKLGEMYRMFIRLMQQADRDGFDGLAVNEHHQGKSGTAYQFPDFGLPTPRVRNWEIDMLSPIFN